MGLLVIFENNKINKKTLKVSASKYVIEHYHTLIVTCIFKRFLLIFFVLGDDQKSRRDS